MRLATCAAIILCMVSFGSAQGQITSEAALDSAIKCVGLEQSMAEGWCNVESITLVVATHDQFSPIRRDLIDGRQVWEVKLSNVVLELEGTRPRSNEGHPREATIYIDPLTGQLLKFVVFDTTWTDRNHDVPWNRLISNAGGAWGGGLSLAAVCPMSPFTDSFGEQSLRRAKAAAQAVDFMEEQRCYSNHPLLTQQVEIYPVVFDHGTGDARPTLYPADNVPAWFMTSKSYRKVSSISADAESLAVYQPMIEHRVFDPSTTEPCITFQRTFPASERGKMPMLEEKAGAAREEELRDKADSLGRDQH
jgi:hypothetical protein